MRPLGLMVFLNMKSRLEFLTIFKMTWKPTFWILVMQILLQQVVWSLVLQLQGSHEDGEEEAEVEVEAGKVLQSRDLVKYHTDLT